MIINKGDGAVQNLDIVLTDNTFASFYHDFMAAAKRLGWNRLIQSHSLSEIKKQFPRAYEKWTDEEDQTLKASLRSIIMRKTRLSAFVWDRRKKTYKTN